MYTSSLRFSNPSLGILSDLYLSERIIIIIIIQSPGDLVVSYQNLNILFSTL